MSGPGMQKKDPKEEEEKETPYEEAGKNEATRWPEDLATGERRCHDRGVSAAEVVEHDVLWLDTQIEEHVHDRDIHHGRTTHVELAILWGWVLIEVIVEQDLVDKARIPLFCAQCLATGRLWILPIILGNHIREG